MDGGYDHRETREERKEEDEPEEPGRERALQRGRWGPGPGREACLRKPLQRASSQRVCQKEEGTPGDETREQTEGITECLHLPVGHCGFSSGG